MPNPTPGQMAYEAYRRAQGAVQHNGLVPTPFFRLSPGTQRQWDAAAQAVLDAFLSSAQRLTPPQEETHGPSCHVCHAAAQAVLGDCRRLTSPQEETPDA